MGSLSHLCGGRYHDIKQDGVIRFVESLDQLVYEGFSIEFQ